MTDKSDVSLSEARPRLGSGMVPAGHLCSLCREREAGSAWGTINDINHGMGEWRCDVCALTEQLEFARERAGAIPKLERALKKARKKAELDA